MNNAVKPVLSVVTTLFQSQPYLSDFHRRMRAAVLQLTPDYEMIFVNDGSSDASLQQAQAIQRSDPRVQIIDLSRNFGHHRAMMAGLSFAQGQQVFLIDCDLEEDPEWLLAFQAKAKEAGADLVFGVQGHRKGRLFERLSGQLFYRLFNLLSDIALPPNPVTARLMSARFVASLLRHQERELFLSGLCAITGFHQVSVPITKHSKVTTSYTLKRRLTLFVQAITSFSERPLVYIFYLGLAIAFLSGAASAYLIYRRLAHGIAIEGWASLMVSLWFLGGLLALCIGVVGIYIARIYVEAKNRPYVIVRDHYRNAGQPE